MARRSSSSFFSPPSRHSSQSGAAARRRSLPLAPHVGNASPSSAPWSRRETAQLVAAWRDVAEHPATARESVDAFQTRLFLRFQEVAGVASSGGDADDTVSMAGSECSMESVEFADASTSSASSSGGGGGSSALFAPRARTQTSVVLRMYALRRMAGFVTAFVAQQEALKTQPSVRMEDVAESQEQATTPDAPVDWFALTKDDQIERFQAAGATSYIELDEHTYQTILTALELQDKCKAEKAALWTEREVRHVLAAWRETQLRTPTRLPGADSFYARFIALNGESSRRSKPEVADMKLALLNMHGVVTAFHNRAPASGKLTRGNLKRQRQNWFALGPAERQRAFGEGRSHQGCGFVDISEDMYATLSELAASSLPSLSAPGESFGTEFGRRRSSFGSGGAAAVVKSEEGSAPQMMVRSSQREMIDLVSDGDEDDGDGEPAAALSASQLSLGDDVDMGEGDGSFEHSEEQANVGGDDSGGDTGEAADEEKSTVALATAHARAAAEAAAKLLADVKADVPTARSEEDGATKPQTADKNGRVRQNSLKKQKLEHHHRAADASGVAALLEKQAQELNALVLQVQEDREREREEREKLLLAMKLDQQGRDAVVELLRAEQDERRRDRDERRQMLQLLMREQQELQQRRQNGVDSVSAGVAADAKARVKSEDDAL